MSQYKYMIYARAGKGSVIRAKGGKLEYIRKDGEKEFDLDDSFWQWWEHSVSYVKGSEVDFCLLYDENYSIFSNDFYVNLPKVNAKESFWNIEFIKQFFFQLKKEYNKVEIIDASQQHILLENTDSVSLSFYTNLIFPESSYIANKDSGETLKEEERQYSAIAQYFKELARKEREGY